MTPTQNEVTSALINAATSLATAANTVANVASNPLLVAAISAPLANGTGSYDALDTIITAVTSALRSWPIIDNIKQIKKDIQENPHLVNEEKDKLIAKLNLIESQVQEAIAYYDPQRGLELGYYIPLILQLLQVEVGLRDLYKQIQSQIPVRQFERFLPLLNLITPLIDTFKK